MVINTMATDDLATQEARASADMVASWFFWNIPVSTPRGLIIQRYQKLGPNGLNIEQVRLGV